MTKISSYSKEYDILESTLPKTYQKFGKHYISKRALFQNRVSMSSKFCGKILIYPAISDGLKNILLAIINDDKPCEHDLIRLSKADKHMLHEMTSKAELNIDIPNPNNKEIERFNALKYKIEVDGELNNKVLEEFGELNEYLFENGSLIVKDYRRVKKKLEYLSSKGVIESLMS